MASHLDMERGKAANRLEQVFKMEVRSPQTPGMKTAKGKENCAEHTGSRIILRNVKCLLDSLEIRNGKLRNNWTLLSMPKSRPS